MCCEIQTHERFLSQKCQTVSSEIRGALVTLTKDSSGPIYCLEQCHSFFAKGKVSRGQAYQNAPEYFCSSDFLSLEWYPERESYIQCIVLIFPQIG